MLNRREALGAVAGLATTPLLPEPPGGGFPPGCYWWNDLSEGSLADRLHNAIQSPQQKDVIWRSSLYVKDWMWYGRFAVSCPVEKSRFTAHPYNKRTLCRINSFLSEFAYEHMLGRRQIKNGWQCSDLLRTNTGRLLRVTFLAAPITNGIPLPNQRIVDHHDNDIPGWWR